MSDVKIVTSLSADTAKTVAELLQPTLVDLIDLSLVGKQVHWTITGVGFKQVHEHLDEIIDTARDLSDEIAEYMSTIGQAPNGLADRVAADSSLPEVPSSYLSVEEVLDTMTNVLQTVSGSIRGRIDAVDDVDPVGGDLLIGAAKEIDKHLWMISASR